MNVLELERRRQAKAAEWKANQPKPDAEPLAGQMATAMADALKAKRESCAKFEAEWEAWLKAHPVADCPTHKLALPVRREESLRVSYQLGEMVAEVSGCPVCAAESARAAFRLRMARAGVPANLLDCSFANWQAGTPNEAKALAAARKFAERPTGGLVIIGKSYGVGKSHLATAVLAQCRGDGLFVHWLDFLTRIRKGYSTGGVDEALQRASRAKILVVDEIGFSTGGKDEIPLLQELLGPRYNERRPFILTGNFGDVTELKPIVGPRMFDRLEESVRFTIQLEGTSRRKSQREQYLGLATEPRGN
jgi:DNA replication protein DnaC